MNSANDEIRSLLSEIDTMIAAPLPVKQEDHMDRQEKIANLYEQISSIADAHANAYKGNYNAEGGRRKKGGQKRKTHRKRRY